MRTPAPEDLLAIAGLPLAQRMRSGKPTPDCPGQYAPIGLLHPIFPVSYPPQALARVPAPQGRDAGAAHLRAQTRFACPNQHTAELMDEIRPLFRQGIVDPFMTTLEEFEREAKRDRATPPPAARRQFSSNH
jgi:hypothetical protein